MMLWKWEKLPPEMQTEEVRKYYDILKKKPCSLFLKRVFDIVVSSIMIVLLSPVFLLLAAAIKIDSKGPVFYRQTRMTQYNRPFRIHKFRTMVQDADKGLQVTVGNDPRITRVGAFVRKYRLDEICQLIDVLRGKMTFVGTRPEVPKYTERYTPEMMATFLLPAGVTSFASICYKDEAELLDGAEDPDQVYCDDVLPAKMRCNLKEIEHFSIWSDIRVMFMTISAVLGKEHKSGFKSSKEDKEDVLHV